jgi:hypothetical protein
MPGQARIRLRRATYDRDALKKRRPTPIELYLAHEFNKTWSEIVGAEDHQKLLNFMAYRQKVARSAMAGKQNENGRQPGHLEGDTFGCAWREDCGDEH